MNDYFRSILFPFYMKIKFKFFLLIECELGIKLLLHFVKQIYSLIKIYTFRCPNNEHI